MNNKILRRIQVGTCAGIVGALASTSSAGLSSIVLEIQAEFGGQVGFFSVPQSAGVWSGTNYNWQLTSPMSIMSPTGVSMGVLSEASVHVIEDPVIAVNFNIISTQQNTNFTIASPLLSFPAMGSALGTASAGVSVTDLFGDGATLTPTGGGAYNAQYNGLVPGGTSFATLLSTPLVAGAFSTVTASEDFPGGGGFVPIAGSVADISARWQFTLSANDLASGTGVFTVVPAPSAIGLLALGGLLGGRRRR